MMTKSSPVISTHEQSPRIQSRLAALRDVLAGAAVGDFSKDLVIPAEEDEFTELFVGVQLMVEVIREQLDELTTLNKALAATADERSQALADAQAMTHLGSWQWDVTTGEISWSDELYRIFGMKPQERQVSFEEFLQLIHPEDRERVSGIIGQAYQTGKPFEFEHRIVLPTHEQRILQGKGKVICDNDGKPLRMLGTAHDITDHKKVELALQQSDERFRAVTQATSDIVYDLDLLDDTLWFSDAIYTEYGYDKKAVEHTLEWWMAHIHPEDNARIERQMISLLSGRRRTWETEYRFQKADGSYAVVRNRAFILRNNDTVPHRIIGTLLDITEQRKLERAKDEFMSLVSHQLRTPLTIVRVYSDMLGSGMIGEITPAQREHVHKISDASVRLINLVRDMLDISRIELGRKRISSRLTDVNKCIQVYVDELLPVAQEKQVRLSFTPNPKLPRIMLDATVFGQIIYNLLENAINYTLPDGHVNVKFVQHKDGYVLSVSDSGIGIPEADQPHIFERFYRADNSSQVAANGTGLGLYLVKLLTDAFGGKLWLESGTDKGTTFYVQIPPDGMHQKSS